ncbi:XRE family transcriptional regulator [Maricaulis parjimensis]|uniref:XRE family transcriptional regulator n=1 Tax=Maricaulis parjimensis TaxID=144023 RepID=UPI00193A7AA3|nr:XRE family transcriptional regulator [Maricaulis parjimensis]
MTDKIAQPKASIGASLDEFLREENIYEDVQGIAIKRVVAWQIAEEMKRQSITKVEMAKRMQTSRSQLDRLLDPDNDKVELATLGRAARALGRELRIGLA